MWYGTPTWNAQYFIMPLIFIVGIICALLSPIYYAIRAKIMDTQWQTKKRHMDYEIGLNVRAGMDRKEAKKKIKAKYRNRK